MLNIMVASIAIGVAIALGYWVQDRAPPTAIKKIEAVQAVVTNGGVLRVRYEVERRRRCHVIVEQLVYDAENVRFAVPDEDYTTEPGPLGADIFTLAVPIPVAAREGRAAYRSVRSYYCNPVHYWFSWPIVITADAEFEIMEGRMQRPNQQQLPPPASPPGGG